MNIITMDEYLLIENITLIHYSTV